ncbi:hypothetical protein [Tenacibaculum ovolyticum]|uniref:hypothetical protein n=1 Tax=Tenacibaculum ovolyticum TaxID=104270 RepID=UPI0007ECB197|nr:hypothetical protein [Tenacibaculum ovolyticum]
MFWRKKKSIVEEFNSDIVIPKYLTNATADVWYDLIGIFFVYDVNQEKFIYSIHIEDNKDKFKDIAIHLFDNYLVSDDYLLLKGYSDYKNLYKVSRDGSISVAQSKTNFSLDDEQDKIPFYETRFFEVKEFNSDKNNCKLDCEKDDIININVSDLDITSKVLGIYSDFETPIFLTDDSNSNDETYIYNLETKKIQLFFEEFSFYQNSQFLYNLRNDLLIKFYELNVFAQYSPIWRFCSIWEYENDKLILVQEAKDKL